MGSAINPDEIKRFEVTEVYTHPDAKVDIVLVHGLNGHPRNTWTAKNGVFWPSQLLPVSLKSAQARILVYGYNADVVAFGSGGGKSGPSSDMIHQHAQTLLANLSLERKSEERTEAPIIWVAHSLGGILVKRALELSHDLSGKNADDLRSIYVSSYGIIFLGTPHNGADPAKWGLILQGIVNAMIPKKLMESHSQLIKTLQSNNETLQNINLKFLDIYPNHLQVCMVHESHDTDLRGTKLRIVDQLSAGPLLPDVTYFGIEATHSGMCKFESKNSPGWTNVSVTLKSWVQEAELAVQRYWAEEFSTRRQKDKSQIDQLRSKYQQIPGLTPQASISAPDTPDPASSVDNSTIILRPVADIQPTQPPSPIHSNDPEEDAPYFIKPSGFRPNSIFVGREAELSDMHKMLLDKRKRAEGTSAVLIQSLPGGGKTHLARQYVYEHKDDFPGGIFWLRAKSQTELAAGFWDIARKAALKHLVGTEDADALNDPQQFIRMVRKWLNHRHDWLLVLDGIHFADTEAMRRFIPDSKNTSLIYTSTEGAVVGDHHFMNPQIIRLHLLSAREAQRLLLLELDKKEPFSKDDLKYSMELVQSMGFLPVVIHAVAKRLKTTNEPLSRFAKSYSNEPRLRGLGTYIAVVEQLKELRAFEALNLIYILSFFSQHIPVEMISLGLRVLDVDVKATEPVIGRHLNSTFKILNMFALIDRNEHEVPQAMNSSQSSKSSRDMLTENVDTIRLHSVVQGFFMDTLAADGTLPLWLDRAVRVFCCSYDMANERIMKKTNAGLVEDYRVYEIHGIKLREHLARYIGKHQSRADKTVLLEAQDMLWERLEAIKAEIDRRTPESSHVIAGGRAEAFQTSIFDRTSSSSDTDPETPGFHDKFRSGVSTWGLEPEKPQHESPLALANEIEYRKHMDAVYNNSFPPLPIPEDPGYDSDREDSVAMTIQPSQRTVQQDAPASPGGAWEVVKPRRQRAEPLPLHRTIKNLERSRYRDRAGSYRSITAVDPRISTDTARGFLHNNSPREPSRERISGQSSAEVALAHIAKTSPPPARGGGMIQDRRRSSSRSALRSRMVTGISSYAAPVSGAVADVISGFGDLIRPSTEPQPRTLDNASLVERPPSSAMASLQRFPIEIIKSAPTPVSPATPRPPYPQSPYLYPGSESGIYQIPGNYSQENITIGPEPFPSNIYPRMEGLPPIEVHNSHASLPIGFNHDVPEIRSESLPSSMILPHRREVHHDPLSLSSPNIHISRQESDISPYYPGLPELSNQGGYSSQPMSRDPSGQSNHSAHSSHSAHSTGLLERRRRPSVAETEPIPQLPVFSPRIAPTSYQVYERMRERDMLTSERGMGNLEIEAARRERENRLVKKSPRLENARAALLQRQLEDWENIPPLQPTPRNWDPTATPFFPSSSSVSNFTYSPTLPPNPANSMLSMSASYPSTTTTSALQTTYPSPIPPSAIQQQQQQKHHTTPTSFTSAFPAVTPRSFNTTNSFPSPLPPQNTPSSYANSPQSDQSQSRITRQDQLRYAGDGGRMERSESVGMERSQSGGIRVGGGRRFIEFGDYPEPVDYELARERVLRSWGEREREVAERRRIVAAQAAARRRDQEGGRQSDELVGLGLGVEMGKSM